LTLLPVCFREKVTVINVFNLGLFSDHTNSSNYNLLWRMMELLLNNELERMLKEVAVSEYEALSIAWRDSETLNSLFLGRD
jgi:hypothetical protein